jgi:hypothetical protein
VVVGEGAVDRYLTDEDVRGIVGDGLARVPIDGRRLLAIIPDGTRMLTGTFIREPRHPALARTVALPFLKFMEREKGMES